MAASKDNSTDDYYVLKSVDSGDNWTDVGGTSILAYTIDFVNDLDGTMSYEDLDYSSLTGNTVTVRIDGTNNVLTEGAEWTAATDNDTTASSLATAIAALSGAGATASGAVVTVTADSTTTGLFLSTNADAAYLSVTNSSRFWVIGGGAWESFDGVTWIQGNGITTAVKGIFYRQGTYYLVGVNKVFVRYVMTSRR